MPDKYDDIDVCRAQAIHAIANYAEALRIAGHGSIVTKYARHRALEAYKRYVAALKSAK